MCTLAGGYCVQTTSRYVQYSFLPSLGRTGGRGNRVAVKAHFHQLVSSYAFITFTQVPLLSTGNSAGRTRHSLQGDSCRLQPDVRSTGLKHITCPNIHKLAATLQAHSRRLPVTCYQLLWLPEIGSFSCCSVVTSISLLRFFEGLVCEFLCCTVALSQRFYLCFFFSCSFLLYFFRFPLWHCFSLKALSQQSFPQPKYIVAKLEPGFGIKYGLSSQKSECLVEGCELSQQKQELRPQ